MVENTLGPVGAPTLLSATQVVWAEASETQTPSNTSIKGKRFTTITFWLF